MKLVQVVSDYIRRSLLTTRGDIVVRGAAQPERLAAGALNYVLISHGAGLQLTWSTIPTPLTTQGDIIVRGATAPERYAAGLDGRILTAQGVGAAPVWEAPALVNTARPAFLPIYPPPN